MKNDNQLWDFFASVKLALFTLCTLAVTSIIGTLIPQHETHAYYGERYGRVMASFIEVLDIADMYGSWWFLGLLGLLSANLIVCSIDRFPLAWRQITADPTSVSAARIRAFPYSTSWSTTGQADQLVERLAPILTGRGWRPKATTLDGARLLVAQKFAWSRIGVYVVHASILIIFAGAIVGHFFGFKGNIMLPETEKSDSVFLAGSQQKMPLGFTVQCDSFAIEFYDNGMPKEYRSRLTILEDTKPVLTQDIEVNIPLKYRGITFYQSSYEGYKDFIIRIKNNGTKQEKQFIAPFQQQLSWSEENIEFGVVNAEAIQNRLVRVKFWFKAKGREPSVTSIDVDSEVVLTQADTTYTIQAKQMYATGLQVAKDPGVWLVYLGCSLMIVGLFIAFFLSHQRIYLKIDQDEAGCTLTLAGTANKNKLGFARQFEQLAAALADHKAA